MEELGIRRTSRLLREAFRLCSQPGPHPPPVDAVAKASGSSAALILYWYGDVETLFRLAVVDRAAALAAPLAWSPPPGTPLGEAVLCYTGISAALFASEDYRRLAYLVMRDGVSSPWLVRQHERNIVEAVEAGLGRVVAQARPRSAILSSGTRAFVKRLQGELALPMLLPRQKQPTRREIRALVETVCDRALNSVYSTAAVARALEQISRPPLAQPGPRPVPQAQAALVQEGRP
ncbi:MAG: hypothetical protein JWO81_1777 [Alphaproteobacteria bacterium]|nr:hypothetical protein [Alphaproteobacteria bacterium]